MASTIQGNVARTRHTDPTNTNANTNTDAQQRTQDSGEAYRRFHAERELDSFTRVSGGGGRLEGFDHQKLNNPSHNTPKYIVGRILQNYPNTPEGLRQALPEIQRHFPEARIAGSKGDLLDFGSHTDPEGRPLGKIDVIRAAGGPNNGEGWQWLPVNGSSGAASNSGSSGAASSGAASGSGASSSGLPGGISLEALLSFLQSPEGQRILNTLFSGRSPA